MAETPPKGHRGLSYRAQRLISLDSSSRERGLLRAQRGDSGGDVDVWPHPRARRQQPARADTCQKAAPAKSFSGDLNGAEPISHPAATRGAGRRNSDPIQSVPRPLICTTTNRRTICDISNPIRCTRWSRGQALRRCHKRVIFRDTFRTCSGILLRTLVTRSVAWRRSGPTG
jgi:hypothetical protein